MKKAENNVATKIKNEVAELNFDDLVFIDAKRTRIKESKESLARARESALEKLKLTVEQTLTKQAINRISDFLDTKTSQSIYDMLLAHTDEQERNLYIDVVEYVNDENELIEKPFNFAKHTMNKSHFVACFMLTEKLVNAVAPKLNIKQVYVTE